MALQTAETNRTAAELEMSRKLTDARLAVEDETNASRSLATFFGIFEITIVSKSGLFCIFIYKSVGPPLCRLGGRPFVIPE